MAFKYSVPFVVDCHFSFKEDKDYSTKIEVSDINKLDISGKRILLVDDNELNREVEGELIGMLGVILEEAENGQEAYNLVKSHDSDYYDMVLMDVQMPIMDGYETTKAIRKLGGEYNKLPILATTANTFDEDKINAINSGMKRREPKKRWPL